MVRVWGLISGQGIGFGEYSTRGFKACLQVDRLPSKVSPLKPNVDPRLINPIPSIGIIIGILISRPLKGGGS